MQLILNAFGTSLQKENGLFVVKTDAGKQHVFPEKVKSIHISKGASISSDAALLALEYEIDVFFTDNTGMPAGRIWSGKYGSISTIRRNQIDFSVSAAAVDWIKGLIVQKINNQSALLLTFTTPVNQTRMQQAIHKMDVYKQKIDEMQAQLVVECAPSLRGWEGAASKVYFGELSEIMPEPLRFAARSMRPALDVFNMLLNYAYGMLYTRVESALIKAGVDPYVGVLHREDYNRPAMSFDVIELYRVWADYVVVSLCLQQVIDADCYRKTPDGGYWLETQGKRILIQSVNDYMDEVILLNGQMRSRGVHIDLYAQQLAQMLLKYRPQY